MDYFADVFKDRIGEELSPSTAALRAGTSRLRAKLHMGWIERDLGATATE